MVIRACDELPPRFQRLLHNVAVTIEDGPPDSDGGISGPLGFYQGTPVGERGTGYSMVLPDKITIYRKPLLVACHSQQELHDEVKLTVLHEIGHYFGIEDHELPF
jgi:predicted Zn-dependent protease with MMP-like domain